MSSNIDDLKKKLELLLGEKDPAPVDMSMLEEVTEEKDKASVINIEKASEASGKMLSAVFSFIRESIPSSVTKEKRSPLTLALEESLKSISNVEADGKVRMQLTFDSQEAVDAMAAAIAGLLEAAGRKEEKKIGVSAG
ncbi:MAG: hypothetical protein GX089_09200 [Fibrobacter sp.]|jgi:hypothetical protein|nr:hypothetical protein [Fibrobacter sp.]